MAGLEQCPHEPDAGVDVGGQLLDHPRQKIPRPGEVAAFEGLPDLVLQRRKRMLALRLGNPVVDQLQAAIRLGDRRNRFHHGCRKPLGI